MSAAHRRVFRISLSRSNLAYLLLISQHLADKQSFCLIHFCSDKNSNNHGDMNHICPICNPTEIPGKGDNNFYIVKHSLNSEVINDKTMDNDSYELGFLGKKID